MSETYTWNPFTVAELRRILSTDVGTRDDSWQKARKKADLISVCAKHLTKDQAQSWTRRFKARKDSTTAPQLLRPRRKPSIIHSMPPDSPAKQRIRTPLNPHTESPAKSRARTPVVPAESPVKSRARTPVNVESPAKSRPRSATHPTPPPVAPLDSLTASSQAREAWLASRKSRQSLPISQSIFNDTSSSTSPAQSSGQACDLGQDLENLEVGNGESSVCMRKVPVAEAIDSPSRQQRAQKLSLVEKYLSATLKSLDAKGTTQSEGLVESPVQDRKSPKSTQSGYSPLLRPMDAADLRPVSRPSLVTPIKLPSTVGPKDTYLLDSFRPLRPAERIAAPWWQHRAVVATFLALIVSSLGALLRQTPGPPEPILSPPSFTPAPPVECSDPQECEARLSCPSLTRKRRSWLGGVRCEDVRPKVHKDAKLAFQSIVAELQSAQEAELCGMGQNDPWRDVYDLVETALPPQRDDQDREEISLVLQEDFLANDSVLDAAGLVRQAFKLKSLLGAGGSRSCTRFRTGLSLFNAILTLTLSLFILSSLVLYRIVRKSEKTRKLINDAILDQTRFTEDGYGVGPTVSDICATLKSAGLSLSLDRIERVCSDLVRVDELVVLSKFRNSKEKFYFAKSKLTAKQ